MKIVVIIQSLLLFVIGIVLAFVTGTVVGIGGKEWIDEKAAAEAKIAREDYVEEAHRPVA